MPTTTKISPRLERISTAILHELRQFLTVAIDDKRLKRAQFGRVVVSKDLSHGKVYFTMDSETPKEILELTRALNKAAPLFRHQLASALDLRMTPELKFYYDEDAAHRAHLLDLMAKL